MIFSTITQNKLALSVDSYNLPTQNSNNIQLKFVQDTENFSGYTPTVAMSLLDSSLISCADVLNEGGFVPIQSDGTFLVQDNILSQDGFLAVAINLTQTTGSTTENIMLGPVVYKIQANISALSPLPPDDNLWQSVVTAFLQSVYDTDYKPQFDQIQQDLENLVTEAQQQQQTAEQQQAQIDNAISVMGDYEIVQEDPTQIRFKKGDGTYGDTVNLGDNLASKSMVNAGYDTYSGNSYSGSASDYGIEIGKASGNYEQTTTNGYQLVDASKLVTTSIGGATVTNNGDGSFTISGSGTLSTNFNQTLAVLSTARKLKKGLLYVKSDMIVTPFIYIDIYWNNTWKRAISNKSSLVSQTEITQEDLDNDVNIKYRFYAGSGQTIKTGTVKPMLYQDGDGTWEPFTGGEPAPNPNYPLEPKFFEPKNGYSVGKNMFDKDNVVANNRVSGVDGTFLSQTGTYRTDYIDINSDFVSIFISGNKTSQKATWEVLAWYDNEKNFISGERMEKNRVFPNKSYEIPSNASYVIFNFRNEDIDEIQLSYGSTEQPYTPFVGQSTTPLNITLRALPNGVCDTYEDGVITRRIGVIEFDGSEDERWGYQSDVNVFSTLIDGVGVMNRGCLCDKIQYAPVGKNPQQLAYLCCGFNQNAKYSNYFYIKAVDEFNLSLDDFKTYLQSNPITVWYELATPTTEAFEIETLQSWYPYTNAWCDSVVQPQQITWNVLTGKSSILDGNGNLIQQGYMSPQDNLLINSDFSSGIINQKGQIIYNGQATWLYGIDMWRAVDVTIDTQFKGQLTISGNGYLTQLIDLSIDTYTLTFKIKNINKGNINVYLEQTEPVHEETISSVGLHSFVYKITKNVKGVGIKLNNFSGDIEFIKLEKGDHFTGMPVWNYALEYLKCCRLLYVWYLPEIPSHGYNSINNLSYFTGTAFPVPFSSAPTWTVKQLLMDQVDVSSDLNTINVTPNRCTSISLTGQISTISGTIIFSNEPS